MANVKKGQTVSSPQWWKHLRKFKRVFWKKQRGSDKEYLANLPDPTPEQLEDIPEVTDWSDATRGKFHVRNRQKASRR